MPSLPELQRMLADSILHEDATLPPWVHPGRLGASRHVQIHRNNVYASLADTLAAVYPVCARLVGDACFRQTAHAYIERTRPTQAHLHGFGRSFPAFVARAPNLQTLPYLRDVCRLEWAYHYAFHAADTATFSIARLASVGAGDYAQLHFALHPSARLIESPYPIVRIWQANQPPDAFTQTIDLAEGGERALVIRRELDVQIEILPPGDYALLKSLARGRPLSAAAAAALAVEPDFDLGAAIKRHVAAGTLVDFHVDRESTGGDA